MKKRTVTVILCFFILNLCFAKTSVWKVVGNGNTIYLAGSIHILRAGDYPLPLEFETAFNSSDLSVFETDIQKLEDPAIGKSLMQKSMYTDDKTLQSVLSEKVYRKLEENCLELSLPLKNFSKFKPSMTIIILSVLKMQQMGMTSEGVDKYFFNKSKDENKGIAFLETVDEQINLITSLCDGIEDEFILYSLEDFEKMEEQLIDLISTWKEGTSTVMIEQIDETKEKFPTLYQSMLVDRNNKWMPKIEKFLEDDKIEFILVGSLHLHGQDGLLKQLRKKGYEVNQL